LVLKMIQSSLREKRGDWSNRPNTGKVAKEGIKSRGIGVNHCGAALGVNTSGGEKGKEGKENGWQKI